MKVLVTGSKGQLGFDILRVFKEKGVQCYGIDKDELDITDEDKVKEYFSNFKPSIIIHCAAYTAVDKAEDEKELCFKVNVLGTKHLVNIAKDINAKFLYISTDYVFDGNGNRPFTIEDVPNPVNYYGITKYEGEKIVQETLKSFYIVRISWVFGINGNNFIKTMLRVSEINTELNIVSDQIGSPTYTYDLADYIYKLIQTNNYGIYHSTNENFCSWSEFAEEIFFKSNKQVKINRILTKDYKTKATRPLNSRLEKNYLKMRPWQEALEHFLIELNQNAR